jgi:hypothetical protein
VIFELYKPLYEWRNLSHPDDPADFDLVLSDEVKEWLDSRSLEYDAYPMQERRDLGKGDGECTYLIFYLDIEDPKAAMLFKLTWM